jgi:hypothetical protein
VPGPADEQHVLSGVDEREGGEFQERFFGQLRVITPVDFLQCLALWEPGVGEAAIEESGAAPVEFILDHPGEGLDKIHLMAADLQGAGR